MTRQERGARAGSAEPDVDLEKVLLPDDSNFIGGPDCRTRSRSGTENQRARRGSKRYVGIR